MPGLNIRDLDVSDDMPPDVRAAIEQAKAEHEAMYALEEEKRRAILRYAWLYCTCRAWPEPGNVTPPQTGCIVHGSVMVTLDGRVL